MAAGVRDYRELDVWKLCDDLRVKVEIILQRPSFREHEKLHDQLEEAVERLCPNIAEGFSRYFPRENAQFVRVALGSLSEIIEHLDRTCRRKIIDRAERDELQALARRARKAATRYAVYLEGATAPNIPRTRPRHWR